MSSRVFETRELLEASGPRPDPSRTNRRYSNVRVERFEKRTRLSWNATSMEGSRLSISWEIPRPGGETMPSIELPAPTTRTGAYIAFQSHRSGDANGREIFSTGWKFQRNENRTFCTLLVESQSGIFHRVDFERKIKIHRFQRFGLRERRLGQIGPVTLSCSKDFIILLYLNIFELAILCVRATNGVFLFVLDYICIFVSKEEGENL